MRKYTTICMGLLLIGGSLSHAVTESGPLESEWDAEGADSDEGGFMIPSKTAEPSRVGIKGLAGRARDGGRRTQAMDGDDDEWEMSFLPREEPSNRVKEVEVLHGGDAYSGLVQPQGVDVVGGEGGNGAQWSFQATADSQGQGDAIKPISDPKSPPKQPPHTPPETTPPSPPSDPEGAPQKEEQQGQQNEPSLGNTPEEQEMYASLGIQRLQRPSDFISSAKADEQLAQIYAQRKRTDKR